MHHRGVGQTRIQTALLGLSGSLVLAVLGLSSGATAEAANQRSYVGTFGGKSRAVLRVDFKHGRAKGGTFQAKNFELLCDDGTYPRVDYAPITIRFTSRKRFTGQLYFQEPRTLGQTYIRIEGHLFAHRDRARGYMFVIEDPSDPPGSANAPECGTYDRSHWLADRLRPGPPRYPD